MSAVSEAERAAMLAAIQLAGHGAADVLPNPVVGCVLLSPDGRTIGQGWHQRYGQAHAEVNALIAASESVRGATAVVTLEPCNHTGRTGPCSEALITAGVARVVIANRDPWAPAAGGVEALRSAGIEVIADVLADEASDMNRVWLTTVRSQRPFVSFKAGITVDGRVAAVDGTSKWITSAASRADVHLLRQRVDTMLVGVGTVLADDPLLTVRDADGVPLDNQPLRVVADTFGRTPAEARVRNDDAETWVATAAEVGAADRKVDLQALLSSLYRRGQRHVLLEGGPRLAASFFDAGLVDEVIVYVAPRLLGAGRGAVEGGSVRTLVDAHELQLREVVRIEEDVKLRYTVRRS